MLKLKDNVDLKELEKFGFVNENGSYRYERIMSDGLVYVLYLTKNHKYIQIEIIQPCIIAGSLQCLLYDLIKDGLVEVVE